ncbi:pseudouridine synthase [Denitromonas sp.]|uniref:pseudouridine synthase n=1 Tax=Denitromonas sp. TaxID=2734609 RepID=UPI002AFE3B46|nr:pseudouridine synthase [Denitromonas sp.]
MPDTGAATDEAPLAILYRDDHLVAIHKPAGLLVHRTALDRHETRFAVQLLRDQIGQHVWPAHRLDRGTSGVLVFALDADTAGRLGQQFEAQTVAKRYVAVVRGHPPESGLIDHPLTRQRDDNEWVDPGAQTAAQPARTTFQRLATIELPIAVDRYPTSRYALLQVAPETGRKHQIRRHLKHISHPIIGDATHGKGRHNRMFAAHFGCQRLLLASTDLWLDHPVSGQRLHLHAAPASDFMALLDHFGWRAALQIQSPPL